MSWLEQHFFDPDGNPLSQMAWAELMETTDRTVARTEVSADVEVSTVWLGINMNYSGVGPPLIYETMIFGGDHDCYQWRTPNRHAALACHDQAVALARQRVHLS